MPFAKFDVDLRDDPRIVGIPENDRPAAIALWWACVLHSAEMLKDGRISATVMEALADDLGIECSRRRDRHRAKLVATLVSSKLLNADGSGGFVIANWDSFHSSRSQVEHERTLAAERKRRSRGQLSLPDVTLDVTPGQNGAVTPGHDRDSRAHVRASTASDSDSLTPPTPSFSDKQNRQAEAFIRNGGYQLTDLSLEAELEQRGIPEDHRHPLRDLAHDLRKPS